MTLVVPTSPGISKAVAEQTLSLPYNDVAAITAAFAEHGNDIAAVIVEPVAGNMNCIPPLDAFLPALRTLCTQYGSVLIFDEVMTGFRVALGGAQERYNITPDLTCLGKIMGGGMPVGAFGGRRDIMEHIAPLGPVYQAGTLSGNPVAMAAGLKTLELISEPGFHDRLSTVASELCKGLQAAADRHNIPFTTQQVGAMFGLFFTDQKQITDFDQACQCNVERFQAFFHAMLEKGIYLAPSAYEAGFVSLAHSPDIIKQTITAADQVFQQL